MTRSGRKTLWLISAVIVLAIVAALGFLLKPHPDRSFENDGPKGLENPIVVELWHAADNCATNNDHRAALVLDQRIFEVLDSLGIRDLPLRVSNLSRITDRYIALRDYVSAEPYCRKAVDLKGNIYGPQDTALVGDLYRLANICNGLRLYDEAEGHLKRARDISLAAYGANSMEAAAAWEKLAAHYDIVLDLNQARMCATKAIAIFERRLDEDKTQQADILYRMGSLFNRVYMKQYDDAEHCFQQALDAQIARLGNRDPVVAGLIWTIGECLHNQMRFKEQVARYETAVALLDTIYGPEHPATIWRISLLGTAYRYVTRYDLAESNLLRALRYYETAGGNDRDQLIWCLKELGKTYDSQARYDEALSYVRKALVIIAGTPVEGTDMHAEVLNALGNIYSSLGRSAAASETYHQALAMRIANRGPNSPHVGEPANNLGELYLKQGEYDSAAFYFHMALAVREGYYGADHAFLVYPIVGLGNLQIQVHNYDSALSLFEHARRICEKAYEPTHLHFAWIYQGMGDAYRCLERYREAEEYYLKAMAIKETVFGANHADIIPIWQALAHLYAATGDYPRSLTYYDKLLAARQRFVQEVFQYTSEQQRLRFVTGHPLVIHSLLSLAAEQANPEVTRRAFEMVLYGKGAVVDAVAADRHRAYCVQDARIIDAARTHGETCDRIATLQLTAWKARQPDVFGRQLKALYQAKDSLEVVLSGCSEFKNERAARKISVAEIAAALPDDGVLLDFIRYTPYRFSGPGNDRDKNGPDRYLAFALTKSGALSATDLGEAQPIDSLVLLVRQRIDADREAFQLAPEADLEQRFRPLSRQLYDAVLAPLQQALTNHDNLYISPDGQLSLLPFEILCTPDNQYAVEKFKISYLSSSRDLLRFESGQPDAGWALLVSNPAYDAPGNLETGRTAPNVALSQNTSTGDAPSPILPGCLEYPFATLPFTSKETDLVRGILYSIARIPAVIREGERATEDVVKRPDSIPRLVHLATHGFFCDGDPADSGAGVDNVLVRSGLAFAGANRIFNNPAWDPQNGDDGILTAFEVSGLNLTRTELVVLSGCETGVGRIQSGEGVFGLRRAFQLAGAQSLVMSLWKISDRETGALMEAFYRNWCAGRGKKEALHQAVLQIIDVCREQYGTTHPFLWGSFVLVGNPR